MSKVKGWSLAVCLLVLIGLSPAWAAEKPTMDFSVDFMSRYIWRGMALSDNSLVIQPSMTMGYKGFSVNFWGNYDTDEATSDEANWNETDFTVSYTYDKLPYGLSLDIGTIYYSLDAAQDSFELYTGLSGTCPVTGISLGFTVYREISHYPGWWFEFSAGKSFALPWKKASLDLSATALYLKSNDEGAYADPDDPTDAYSGWLNLDLSASVSIPITEYLTVTPTMAYSFSLSDDADKLLAASSWDNNHDHFYGGVSLSVSF